MPPIATSGTPPTYGNAPMDESFNGFSSEEMKRLLDYDPSTGVFRWKITVNNNGARAGDVAGYLSDRGYWKIKVGGKLRRASHLAWFYVYGEYPKYIDHKDRNKLNNCIDNLRKSTHQQNLWNQSLRPGRKYKGTHRDPKRRPDKQWTAHITVDYKTKYLGSYATEEEAARAYDAKAKELFGEFASINFPE